MKHETILVPVDFSPSALEAASTAIDMVRDQGGGKIIFLHVIDSIYYDLGWMSEGILIPRDVVDQSKEKIAERLKALVTVDDFSGIEAETLVVEGTPYLEITRAIEKLEPDLIVMGTHGRRGVSHMFLGSVAEKIVRMAPCPVLTVKAEGANDADLAA
jgi:nucleotide-binding universal stress UspA family protein